MGGEKSGERKEESGEGVLLASPPLPSFPVNPLYSAPSLLSLPAPSPSLRPAPGRPPLPHTGPRGVAGVRRLPPAPRLAARAEQSHHRRGARTGAHGRGGGRGGGSGAARRRPGDNMAAARLFLPCLHPNPTLLPHRAPSLQDAAFACFQAALTAAPRDARSVSQVPRALLPGQIDPYLSLSTVAPICILICAAPQVPRALLPGPSPSLIHLSPSSLLPFVRDAPAPVPQRPHPSAQAAARPRRLEALLRPGRRLRP